MPGSFAEFILSEAEGLRMTDERPRMTGETPVPRPGGITRFYLRFASLTADIKNHSPHHLVASLFRSSRVSFGELTINEGV